MKFLGYFLASLCLLGFSLCSSVRANIYSYTDADGSVSLSNVPADNRYRMLVPEQNGALVAESEKLPVRVDKEQFDEIVAETARTYGLEGALLHAVISVESSYNPRALSPKGAAGLMQLMPAIAKRYGVSDRFDPAQNLHGGAQYLRDLLTRFNSDVSLALAAYNAGETAVIKHGKRIPPFRETRNYVPRVLAYYRQYRVKA